MKTQWTDGTSYSRDDKERIPTTWELRVGKLRIWITNGHVCYKGIWIMTCPDLNLREIVLLAKTKEEAQREAIKDIADLLEEHSRSIKEVVG